MAEKANIDSSGGVEPTFTTLPGAVPQGPVNPSITTTAPVPGAAPAVYIVVQPTGSLTSDSEHYKKNFPRQVAFILSSIQLISAVLAIIFQVKLKQKKMFHIK